ncbi:hypothetical protein IF2G_09604 [Cordyceps javanica]|nr:hypothetical protein IF2G_09604 [Cordyceps javanica]
MEQEAQEMRASIRRENNQGSESDISEEWNEFRPKPHRDDEGWLRTCSVSRWAGFDDAGQTQTPSAEQGTSRYKGGTSRK